MTDQEMRKGIIVDKVERELPKCPKCKGRGVIEVGTLKGGIFRGGNIDCPTCRGIGYKS